MNRRQLNILVVDDSEQDYTVTHDLLQGIRGWQFIVSWASTCEVALAQIAGGQIDLCLLDADLDGCSSLELVQRLSESNFTTPVVLLARPEDHRAVTEAMETGVVVDYLIKGQINPPLLERTIRYGVRHRQIAAALDKQLKERTEELTDLRGRHRREINRWKQTSRALQESKKRYRRLFDLSVDAIELLDAKGKIVECNNMYQRLVGADHAEIIGRHTTAFASEKDKNEFEKNLLPLIKEGLDVEGEVDFIRKDGSVRRVWRRFQTIYDDGGEFARIMVYNRDITERVQAVEQLRHLALAIEQNPVALLITDLIGKIEYVNFRFSDLTGYDDEEVIGKNVQAFKPQAQPLAEFKAVWNMVLAGNSWQKEYRNRTKEGESYWELLAIAPMFSMEGKITHCIVAKEDVTLRKEAEAAAMSSQQRLGAMATEHISDLTAANEKLQHEIAERRRVEEELRRSQARLEAQYKGIPVPTYSWERQGDDFVLVDYNDAAAETTGGNIANLMGKTVGGVFKDRPQVLADFAQCFADKATVEREAPYQLLSTGEIRHFVTTYNFMPPNLIIVHIQDITDHKQVEAELRERQKQSDVVNTDHLAELSQVKERLRAEINKREQVERESAERLRQVSDNINERLREQYRGIPIPTYSWQRIGEEFILVDFNDAAAKSMGRIVDFVGKAAGDIFKERPQVLADFERCYTEKMTVKREAYYQLVTTGEQRFFVTTYIFASPNLVIVHIQDITAQKQMETQLRAYREKYGQVPSAQVAEVAITNARLPQANDEPRPTEPATPPFERSQEDHIRSEQTQEALREARTRLKAQYKDVPISTYYWQKVGEDFALVDYNDAAEKATKGNIAEFVGKTVNNIFKERPQVRADFARCYTEKMMVKREAPYKLLTTGETRYFVTTYNFLPPDLIIVYIQDITEHKQIEAV